MAASLFGSLVLAAATLTGCGSSSSVKAGPIVITATSGSGTAALTSLVAGTSANVRMTPVNDPSGAGVDWTVTCGGNPNTGSLTGGACGVFAPAHTSDGGVSIFTAPQLVPVGTTVTLTASLTSDPSASSTLTIPIVTLPISVVLTAAPTSVTAGDTVLFNAAVLNDLSGLGVTWSLSSTCTASACGTLSNASANAVNYTAPATVPAPNTVTISATSVADPTRSASTQITILPPTAASQISVVVTPTTVYATTVGAARVVKVVATVIGDAAGLGVKWAATCTASNCGQTPQPSNSGATAIFLANGDVPVGGTITLTATSDSDPSATASATVTIVNAAPITVTFTSPPPSSLAESATTQLAATVSGTTNTAINWSCAPANACGSFAPANPTSLPVTYTAPSTIPSDSGLVMITATSAASSASTPGNEAVGLTTITTPAPTIAFVQQPPSSVATTATAQVSAAVTNDAAPGGVTWSVTCGSAVPGACGSIGPYRTADGATATYTAPPTAAGSPVQIVATSTAFTGITIGSSPITITPSTNVTVNFIPSAPSQLSSYAVVNLNASVTNDPTNAGVDWQVCASGCGFFTTVAATPAIPATPTTPFVPAAPAVTATSVLGWPNGLPITYTAPEAGLPAQTVTLSLAAHASPTVTTQAQIAITENPTGPTLNGTVNAGLQPVAGSSVALYAAGTSGYASASTQVYAPGTAAYGTTNSTGGFTLAGGYTCPSPQSEMYLVAFGGTSGSFAANPNLSLMTALGPCSNLSSQPIVINEVTAAAATAALAPFAANYPLTGNNSYLYIGTSSTNLLGLANAFASINNLVDITTGQPRFTVPAGDAAVPYVAINTLADVINACTASAGGTYRDGSACGTLFYDTAPLSSGDGFTASLPTDTLQAAFDIAQHPNGNLGYAINVGDLDTLASQSSPFQPILSAVPNDFSFSLNYSGAGGLTGSGAAGSFALDASDNLWISQTNANNIVELNNQGAPISPTAGFSAGNIVAPGPLAIDASNDVWISGSNGLTELYTNGLPALGSPFMGGSGGAGMAFDGVGNLWLTNGAGVAEFNSVGSELSPKAGYAYSGVSSIGAIAVDDSNNIWVADNVVSAGSAGPSVSDLNDTSGQIVVNVDYGESFLPSQIAVGASGAIWFAPSGLCEAPAYGGLGTQEIFTCYAAGDGSNLANNAIEFLDNPGGVAIDGAGNVWVASAGSPGVCPANVSETLTTQVTTGSSPASFDSASLAAGPMLLAIDGSGNVWVLLSDNTITEYIGVATPTVTPLALAVKNKKLGAKP
jgi:hypothetical protein